MILYIAEKPSLARAIAAVLPQPHTKKRSCIECGNNEVVAWCAGHILELAPPAAYDEAFASWSFEHLPIVPQSWKHTVSATDLLKNLQTLLSKAKRVVHAGDPDREGQLLVEEVLVHLGYAGPVDRLLISDLNPAAVKKALGAIQSNAAFQSLYQAALARQRADWLYGLNMTRLYTLLGKAGGYEGVLSVGRVQTPLLGLVVQRDSQIESFVPVPYYPLQATLQAQAGTFQALFKPGEGLAAVCDDQNRLLCRQTAADLQSRLQGQTGTITKVESSKKETAPPLPYCLADLQIDASKALGVSAKDVLDACQSLYEKHRRITYPRSDCRYLPEGHCTEAAAVIAAITVQDPELGPLAQQATLTRRSRAWNDKKISAHHGIIPTPQEGPAAALTELEQRIYRLISLRYLAQFFPPHRYLQTHIEATLEGQLFCVSGRQTHDEGWRVLYAKNTEVLKADTADCSEDETAPLPSVSEGDSVVATQVQLQEKKTQPPPRFTEASLLKAMSNIARFVSDPAIKKVLKQTDGIGTPATQAAIIQTLFERTYIQRKGKQIVSTATGQALIGILPEVATRPDLTAFWESAMQRIQDRELPLQQFLAGVQQQLSQLIDSGKALGRLELPGVQLHPCPACKAALRRYKGKNGYFWACTDKSCKTFLDDVKGQPVQKEIYPCPSPDCTGHLRRIKGKNGYFWACSEYRNGCKTSQDDCRGKPATGKSTKKSTKNH